jgi:hypothetical protein
MQPEQLEKTETELTGRTQSRKTNENLVMKGPRARWVGERNFLGGVGYAAADQAPV